MENYFNNVKLGQILFKWKWHLVIIAVVASIAGYAGSFLLETRYKSTAIIYPSNIAPYSEESETEQMLQWLQGQDIRDGLIKKFNLDKHYELDSNYKYFKSSMEWELSKRIKISKNEYEAIEIAVKDKDPQVAYDMVNEIMNLVTIKVRAIHKMKFEEVKGNAEFLLSQSDKDIEDTYKAMREISEKYGITNYEAQTEDVSKALIGAVDGGAGKIISNKELKKLEANLKSHGAEFHALFESIEAIMGARTMIYNTLNIARMDANREYTYINMVTKPYVADKKDSPKRLFVAFYALVASLLLSIITITILEGIKFGKAN
jgi:uncharacterized protein involved in exopolysaccharide biosynthesis